MRRITVVAVLAALVSLLAIGSASAARFNVGRAHDHPDNGSGIHALFFFGDDTVAQTNRVHGEGDGMTPGPFEVAPGIVLPSKYLSLIYVGTIDTGTIRPRMNM